MAITIGKKGSGSPLQIGWNNATFVKGELDQSKKDAKDYLKVIFEIEGQEVFLFQSEPNKGGYIGTKTLENIVNGFCEMYRQVSRPVEETDELLADWKDKCTEFESFLGSVFDDYDEQSYKEADEEDQLKMLGNYFTDAACKAFCDDNVDNIAKYSGVEGKLLAHYKYDSSKEAWFTNVVGFDKSLTYTFDSKGEKVMKKQYPVTKPTSPFTTDANAEEVLPILVFGKYGVCFEKEDKSTPAATTPPSNTETAKDW